MMDTGTPSGIPGMNKKREHMLLIVSAIVGIFAFILILKRGSSASSVTPVSSLTGDTGTGASSGGLVDSSGSPTALGAALGSIQTSLSNLAGGLTNGAIGTPPSQLNLAYSINEGSQFQGSNSNSNTSNLGLFGGGFGFGIGGSNTSSKSFSEVNSDMFQTTTSEQGLAATQVVDLENFLKEVGGTYQQHVQTQQGAQGDYNTNIQMVGVGNAANVKTTSTTSRVVNGVTLT